MAVTPRVAPCVSEVLLGSDTEAVEAMYMERVATGPGDGAENMVNWPDLHMRRYAEKHLKWGVIKTSRTLGSVASLPRFCLGSDAVSFTTLHVIQRN